MRSKYYSSHAGMLSYLAQEFRTAASIEHDGRRFTAYADVLDRIISDLTTEEERAQTVVQPVASAHS
ncbi:MAG: hypothetical protein ACTSX7_13980 [Alphaproteobacteria bacterium]